MRRVGLLAATAVVFLLSACSGGGPPVSEAERLFNNNCAACHGTQGEGDIGPALNRVVEVFPDIRDQVNWVARRAFETEGPYGANGSGNNGAGATQGRMPAFERKLSIEEIREIVVYERTTFGGEPLESPPG